MPAVSKCKGKISNAVHWLLPYSLISSLLIDSSFRFGEAHTIPFSSLSGHSLFLVVQELFRCPPKGTALNIGAHSCVHGPASFSIFLRCNFRLFI